MVIKSSSSSWDQFCEFTSLIGFRLLHSNQPVWLRVLTFFLMMGCSILLCLQTLYFWDKFRQSSGQRVATVKETEGQPLRQPRFLVCVTQQTASLLHGHGGSVDFRQIVYNYQMEAKIKEEFIKQLQTEWSMVELFLNTTFESIESASSAGMEIARKLRLFKEIKAALWVRYQNHNHLGNTFDHAKVAAIQHTSAERYSGDYRTETSPYAILRSSLDHCLTIYLRDTHFRAEKPKFNNSVNSLHFDDFIQCRMQKVRRIFDEFDRLQKDYFNYAKRAWMNPKELIVKSIFFNDGPGKWEKTWQIDAGQCAIGGPRNRSLIEPSAIGTEQYFDYILIKTNKLEAHPNSRIFVQLIYEENGSQIRANSFELISGKSVEVTLRGMSEIMDEDCTSKYELGCVPSNFTYSTKVCRWCKAEVRSACPCANPELHLPEFIGEKRKCALIEAMRCGPIQRELYQKAECPNACVSIEYTADYAAHELTLEMLNMSIGEAQHKFMGEQLELVDKMNAEHKYAAWRGGGLMIPRRREEPSWSKEGGAQTRIWKATAELSNFLDDYYVMMITVFRLLYGSSFNLPPFFAEDFVGLMGEVPPPDLAPLSRMTELDLAKLELCGEAATSEFGEALKRIGVVYLGYFRNSSFRIWYPWYPCPVSVSNENCRILLNDSSNAVRDIQALIGSTSYRQGTLELALTLNSTPPNPIPIAQFYGHAEENLQILNQTMHKLRTTMEQFLELLGMKLRNVPEKERNRQNGSCLQTKSTLIRNLLEGNTSTNWPILAKPPKGRWNNAWFERFGKFLAQNTGARLLPDYLTSNMALFTVHYRGLTFQHIIYRDDYTLWELLSDVGGVLGLYFGLTIITVYEFVVFAFLVDRNAAKAGHNQQQQRQSAGHRSNID